MCVRAIVRIERQRSIVDTPLCCHSDVNKQDATTIKLKMKRISTPHQDHVLTCRCKCKASNSKGGLGGRGEI